MSIDIDELIHQPIRTKIMAHLGNTGESNYTDLKKSLDLSDGHMSTHMKKLIHAKYVVAKKTFVNQKPNTAYKLSSLGRRRLTKYLDMLKSLISDN